MRGLYDAHGRVPLWLDGNRLQRRAEWLVSALADVHTEALRLDAYPLDALRRALAPLLGTSRGAQLPTPEQLAEVDVLLTSAYVAFAEDLLTGQIDPKSVSQDWHIEPREADVDTALARALHAESLDSALALLRPQDGDYVALRGELARYRGIVATGGWPRLPVSGTLKPGDTTTAELVAVLVEQLRVEGYAPDGGSGAQPRSAGPEKGIYDASLAAAVASFQARHGLAADGILGPSTWEVLNMPAEYRLQQIAANLERYRWLPRTLGDCYVLVNVPAFFLEAYDGGKPVLLMKVIVGAEYRDRATPAFADTMS